MLAVPVAQSSVADQLSREVDELVCVLTPADLYAIGLWYDTFPQLRDEDVQQILARAAAAPAAPFETRSTASLDGAVRPR